MDLIGLLIFLVIGAVAGWLAGLIMKGGGFGLLGNMVVGIIGAVIGGFV
ncbi:MAG TPA: GlsB/YeaQ/YmgE family stress response membrane protein, partial [Gammaproteobacteria bacterium]|nr:GlsB/YeaQ/YmgE family stress response membrane protein [Gammaproteobacteria bacterium]